MLSKWLAQTKRKIENIMKGKERAEPDPEREKIYREIEEARKDWAYSRVYFNTVTEAELIDHAIFAIEAAEKKYVYLLRKIREKYHDQAMKKETV